MQRFIANSLNAHNSISQHTAADWCTKATAPTIQQNSEQDFHCTHLLYISKGSILQHTTFFEANHKDLKLTGVFTHYTLLYTLGPAIAASVKNFSNFPQQKLGVNFSPYTDAYFLLPTGRLCYLKFVQGSFSSKLLCIAIIEIYVS